MIEELRTNASKGLAYFQKRLDRMEKEAIDKGKKLTHKQLLFKQSAERNLFNIRKYIHSLEQRTNHLTDEALHQKALKYCFEEQHLMFQDAKGLEFLLYYLREALVDYAMIRHYRLEQLYKIDLDELAEREGRAAVERTTEEIKRLQKYLAKLKNQLEVCNFFETEIKSRAMWFAENHEANHDWKYEARKWKRWARHFQKEYLAMYDCYKSSSDMELFLFGWIEKLMDKNQAIKAYQQ